MSVTQSTSTRSADGRPEFLVRLGVLLPCTPEDVEQAYLEKVKTAHPDRGGSQRDFLELQTAYQRAKEYARFQASRRHWLGESIERYAEQQEFIAALNQRGGTAKTAPLDWLACEIGEDFAQVMETIDGIGLVGPEFDDTAIEFLLEHQEKLGQLHWIDLSNSSVTDEGTAKLVAFPYLRRLDLSRTAIGNRTLKACASLFKLEWLNVARTRVGRWGLFWLRVARPDMEIATGKRSSRGFRSQAPLFGVICVLYLTAMAVATHIPLRRVHFPEWRLSVDKIWHFSAYALLTFLLAMFAASLFASAQGKGWTRWLRYLLILPLVGAYGALDELTQPLFGRHAHHLDWIADVLGAIAGILCFIAVRYTLKRIADRRWRLLAERQMSPLG